MLKAERPAWAAPRQAVPLKSAGVRVAEGRDARVRFFVPFSSHHKKGLARLATEGKQIED